MCDHSFFDADYFERGVATGKSLYENYRWMPRRSFREALAIIEWNSVEHGATLLDVGCAKGFLVRALRHLDVDALGVDVSRYALGCADEETESYVFHADEMWSRHANFHFDGAFAKDVLEHCTEDGVVELLRNVGSVTDRFACVVPLGDGLRYRIQDYERDPSHVLRFDEYSWMDAFIKAGWHVENFRHSVPGLKDKWFRVHPFGNGFFLLQRGSHDCGEHDSGVERRR